MNMNALIDSYMLYTTVYRRISPHGPTNALSMLQEICSSNDVFYWSFMKPS